MLFSADASQSGAANKSMSVCSAVVSNMSSVCPMVGAGADPRVFWSNELVGSITALAFILLFWLVISRPFEQARGVVMPVKRAN